MCVIYVTSRIPQLKKILDSGNVEDLAILVFISTFVGNSTQFLSLVTRPASRFSRDYLEKTSPYFINAFLCALQDASIMIMIYRYTGGKYRKHNGDSNTGTPHSIHLLTPSGGPRKQGLRETSPLLSLSEKPLSYA